LRVPAAAQPARQCGATPLISGSGLIAWSVVPGGRAHQRCNHPAQRWRNLGNTASRPCPSFGPAVDALNICRGPLSRNRAHHKLFGGGLPSRAYTSKHWTCRSGTQHLKAGPFLVFCSTGKVVPLLTSPVCQKPYPVELPRVLLSGTGKDGERQKKMLPKVLTPDHYSLVLCLRLGLTDRSP
jgi:hypothetical protein